MSDFEKVHSCDICGNDIEIQRDPSGKAYWNLGNNALPVKEGRACGNCDYEVVIPARLRQMASR